MLSKIIDFPKISIITATQNSELFLEECIESVINQSYLNIEYIIVDGQSTDKTIEIIKKKEKYISRWISEKDDGLYDALNKGVKIATGEYIGFLHSDDIFADADVIKKIANILKSNQYDLVHSNLKIVESSNVLNQKRFVKLPNFNLFKLKIGLIPPHPTIYYRRNIHEHVGYYDNSYHIAGDYDMILRMMMTGKIKERYLNINSIIMRDGGKSNSGLMSKIKINMEILKSARKNKFETNLFFLLLKIPKRIIEYLINK